MPARSNPKHEATVSPMARCLLSSLLMSATLLGCTVKAPGGDDDTSPPPTDGRPPPPPPTDGGPPPDDGAVDVDGDIDARPPNPGDCSDWQVGTLTGYDNSNSGDDPNAGSVMEFTGLTAVFYDNVDMAAVDFSDWGGDKYRWIDVNFNGTVGRVGAWDACRNEDCPDGRQCCTENKELFAQPGYLVDVEVRTARRLWGVQNGEDTLQDRIEYRLCGSFDPDEIADRYGVRRTE